MTIRTGTETKAIEGSLRGLPSQSPSERETEPTNSEERDCHRHEQSEPGNCVVTDVLGYTPGTHLKHDQGIFRNMQRPTLELTRTFQGVEQV